MLVPAAIVALSLSRVSVQDVECKALDVSLASKVVSSAKVPCDRDECTTYAVEALLPGMLRSYMSLLIVREAHVGAMRLQEYMSCWHTCHQGASLPLAARSYVLTTTTATFIYDNLVAKTSASRAVLALVAWIACSVGA